MTAPLLPPESPQPLKKRGFMASIRAYFFTGLLVAGPLAITAYISWWLIGMVDGWMKPLIPYRYNPDNYLPFPVPGFGIVVAFLALTVLGFLTASLVGRTVLDFGEGILSRMPFVRSLYKGVKQIFETVFKQDGTSFRRVGLIEWPGPGLWSLCFVTEPTRGRLAAKLPAGGEGYLNIFVPCTPNPTTGYFVVVHQDRVTDIDLTPEEAFKLIMSMGIIQPDGAHAHGKRKKHALPPPAEAVEAAKPAEPEAPVSPPAEAAPRRRVRKGKAAAEAPPSADR